MLERIADRGVREQIVGRAEKLADEPEKQGKALLGELAGLRSLRASGQRYRIIYRVERGRVLVVIVAVGIRKQGSRRDVYELAQKLFRARLVDQ
jgi:mRNA interferase RelE/StbE